MVESNANCNIPKATMFYPGVSKAAILVVHGVNILRVMKMDYPYNFRSLDSLSEELVLLILIFSNMMHRACLDVYTLIEAKNPCLFILILPKFSTARCG